MPTTSSRPSPSTSPISRTCWLASHPVLSPRSLDHITGGSKPDALPSATCTPLGPSPIRSANRSLFRFARARTCVPSRHPVSYPNAFDTWTGSRKRTPFDFETHTPFSPNPTRSARPSPSTSLSKRRCLLLSHPCDAPNARNQRRLGVKFAQTSGISLEATKLPTVQLEQGGPQTSFAVATNTPQSSIPTKSALTSPETSPTSRA